MSVIFKNFEVSENEKGELVVTAKSGFTFRVSLPVSDLPGVHIHGKVPGDIVTAFVVSVKSKLLRRQSARTISLFEREQK